VALFLLYLVGLDQGAAGLLAFVVATTVGEPQVDKPIAFEGLLAQRHHDAAEAELVSRTVHNTVGLGAGVIVFGVAIGSMFALVFALAYGRLGALTARGTAAALGLMGFVAVYLVPTLKYPPAPPAVGNGHDRAAHGAVRVDDRDLGRRRGARRDRPQAPPRPHRRLVRDDRRRPRLPRHRGRGRGRGLHRAARRERRPAAAVGGRLEGRRRQRVTFPPVKLCRFRIASLAAQAITWATLAIGFGFGPSRVLERDTQQAADAVTGG
jgi:Probable cobalt transporter subunit (CbtA)